MENSISKKKKILLLYSNYSTFVKEDEGYLSEDYIVIKYKYLLSKNFLTFVLELLKITKFLILNTRKIDVIYSWFADYYSLPAMLFGKLFNKTNIIIVGGYDAVSIPVIKFGVFYKKNLRYCFVKYSYKLADYIVPVDESLIEGINKYADPTDKGLKIGIKNYIHNIKAKFISIPTGYDPVKWKTEESNTKLNEVISIGGAPNLQTYKRKGFDFLIDVAKEMPNVSFSIVGLSGDMKEIAEKNKSDNVNLLGFIPNEELPKILSRYKVFAQFSLSEGLPNTLCEAMLCECIPVGSNVNGIPTAIGDTGYIIEKKDVKQAVIAINDALHSKEELGNRARQRIINKYPKELRRKKLKQIIGS